MTINGYELIRFRTNGRPPSLNRKSEFWFKHRNCSKVKSGFAAEHTLSSCHPSLHQRYSTNRLISSQVSNTFCTLSSVNRSYCTIHYHPLQTLHLELGGAIHNLICVLPPLTFFPPCSTTSISFLPSLILLFPFQLARLQTSK